MPLNLSDKTSLARLHDQARCEALRLRREAMRDFWCAADAAWRRTLAGAQAQALRGAAGLQARLTRRADLSTAPALTKA